MGPNTKISLEEATQLKFAPFIGLTIDEIAAKLNYDSKSKSRKFLLTQHILSKNGKRVSLTFRQTIYRNSRSGVGSDRTDDLPY